MWWLWASTAGAADCSPNEDIKLALVAWLHGEKEETTAALARAATGFGCSAPVEPQTLARYWLIEGAALSKEGDQEAAGDDFAAARRVAPEVWLPDLGALHAQWEAAASPGGIGKIVLDPPAGARQVWIDGSLSQGGDLAAGLHLVQVGSDTGSNAEFATSIWVGPGVSALVQTGLPTIAVPVPVPKPDLVGVPGPVPVPVPGPVPRLPRPPPKDSLLWAHLLAGGSAAIGEALESGELEEPSVKVAVPVELGLGVRAGPVVARIQAGRAWLVGGQYLASTDDRELSIAAQVNLGLGVAAGTSRIRAGLCGGASWPSRLAGRALLQVSPVRHMVTELRLGANLPTQRALEPAGELMVGVAL